MRVADDPPAADDYASIDRAADELHRRGWRKRFSLNEVVSAWEWFVGAVERGYDMTIYEYTNDLSIRRWAEEARPLLTERVVQWMDQALAPLDDRFRAATLETDSKLPGAGRDQWWECRLPRVLVGELAEDVDRMGLRGGSA